MKAYFQSITMRESNCDKSLSIPDWGFSLSHLEFNRTCSFITIKGKKIPVVTLE